MVLEAIKPDLNNLPGEHNELKPERFITNYGDYPLRYGYFFISYWSVRVDQPDLQ